MAFALIARAKDGSLRLLDTQMFMAPRFAMAKIETLAASEDQELRSSEILLADLEAALPVLVVWPSTTQQTPPQAVPQVVVQDAVAAADIPAPAPAPAPEIAEQPAPEQPAPAIHRLREDSDLFIIADTQRMASLKELIASVVDEVCAKRETEEPAASSVAAPAAAPSAEFSEPDALTCDDCVFCDTCSDAGSSEPATCATFQEL